MKSRCDSLKTRLNQIEIVNNERVKRYNELKSKAMEIEERVERNKNQYTILEFIRRTSAEFYRVARESNLKALGDRIGEFMTNVLSANTYEVELKIGQRGNFDYLDARVNGLEPKHLSGGEKQVFSLAMVAECSSNGVLVLDETINSLDPIALDTILEYLIDIGNDKQVFMVELDDNLDLPYTFISEDNTVNTRTVEPGELHFEDIEEGFND